MKKKVDRKKPPVKKGDEKKKAKKKTSIGYPLYPAKEDIFNTTKEEKEIVLGKRNKNKNSIKNKNKFDSDLLGDETANLNPEPDEELEHMVTDDDENDDYDLNTDGQFDLGGED